MSDLIEQARKLSRDMLALDMDMKLPEGSVDPDDLADALEAKDASLDLAVAAIEAEINLRNKAEAVVEAARGMKRIIEEAGCSRWASDNGLRLKDTPEWVETYNAITAYDKEASHE